VHEFKGFTANWPQYEMDDSTFRRTVSSTQAETIYLIPRREKLWPVEKWCMKSKMKMRIASLAALLAVSMGVSANAAQAPSRFVGTITEVGSGTLTVKTDAGEVFPVEIPSTAALKRIAPGQKDLSTAETIQFSDLTVGDRALVKLDPDAPAGKLEALQVVAIKQSDVAQKQQKDREDWQRRGVGGLVKSVDAAAGTILLSSGAGPTAKTVTVHVAKTTMLKRYAPTSVRFDAAQPATLDAIHVGDQLRARGEKNAAGTEIAAEEVVSGAFRNVSGMIVSIDTASSTLVVKDLASKKPVTIHITADAQMRRLPDRMASMLAMALKGTGAGSGAWSGKSPAAAGAPTAGGGTPAAQHAGMGQSNGMGGQNGGGDPQQMLSRAPAIQIADLKKGEAVMLVSTEGTTDVTAITLLAGVEPLLESPAASQNMLSNWSMSGGGAEAAQ
jgi:hypothetical protein